MNQFASAALREAYGKELNDLLKLLLAGKAVTNWADLERRLVQSVATLVSLHDVHRLDHRGRCLVCRPIPRQWWRPWQKRSTCTVDTTLCFHMRPPQRFALAALEGSFSGLGTS
ncbi:MAG: hypothetical protein ACREP9_05955 [Candidatus Dormibacteraceae bacterium]